MTSIEKSKGDVTMMTEPKPQPNGSSKESALDDEPVELTEEEKKLDKQYQKDLHEYRGKLMREISLVLADNADLPFFATTKTETTEYAVPVALHLAAAYLRAGPSPLDPLYDKGDCSGSTIDIVSRIVDVLINTIGTMAMRKAQQQPPQSRPWQHPLSPPSQPPTPEKDGVL